MAAQGERLMEQVKHDILIGRWAPGTRLSPADLALMYTASKTVVREALAALSGTGLIVVHPNRGFFVMSLSLRELRVLTDLRCYTEGLALRMSIERGGEEWESGLVAAHFQLERAHRRRSEDPKRTDEEWAAHHRAFHSNLVGASGIPMLTATIGQLADATELYRRWSATSEAGSFRDVEGEHRAILEAALDHDADLAVDLLRRHYETTMDVLLAAGLVNIDEGAPSASEDDAVEIQRGPNAGARG